MFFELRTFSGDADTVTVQLGGAHHPEGDTQKLEKGDGKDADYSGDYVQPFPGAQVSALPATAWRYLRSSAGYLAMQEGNSFADLALILFVPILPWKQGGRLRLKVPGKSVSMKVGDTQQ